MKRSLLPAAAILLCSALPAFDAAESAVAKPGVGAADPFANRCSIALALAEAYENLIKSQ
jgi:hypothetical protein